MTRLSLHRFRPLVIVAACAAVASCATNSGRPQLTTENRLHVAEAAAATGNARLASAMYGEAAAADPADSALQVQAAEAMAKLGRVQPARALIEERLKARPNDPMLLRGAASLAVDAGDTQQALAIYDELLRARPADVDAKVDKAVALDLLGRHDQAQPLYRQALLVRAGDPVITNDLAMSLMLQGHVHQATTLLAPIGSDATSPGRARDNLGLLYALDGDKAKSRALIGDRLSDNDVARIAQAVGGEAMSTAPGPSLAVAPSAAIPVATAAMPPAHIPGTAVALAETAPAKPGAGVARLPVAQHARPKAEAMKAGAAERKLADLRREPRPEVHQVAVRKPVRREVRRVWHPKPVAKWHPKRVWHPKKVATWHPKRVWHPKPVAKWHPKPVWHPKKLVHPAGADHAAVHRVSGRQAATHLVVRHQAVDAPVGTQGGAS